MGQTVLANQFIAGLRPELKAKVVGTEGNLEQLLLKARFEEAKRKELAAIKTNPLPKKPVPSQSVPPPQRSAPSPQRTTPSPQRSTPRPTMPAI